MHCSQLYAPQWWSRAEDDRRLGVGGSEAEAQRAQQRVELGRVLTHDAELVVGRSREVQDLGDRVELAGGGREVVGVRRRRRA